MASNRKDKWSRRVVDEAVYGLRVFVWLVILIWVILLVFSV